MLGEKRHVVTIELKVRPCDASALGTATCHLMYEEEVESHISADIKEAVDAGVQSAYHHGEYGLKAMRMFY